MSAPVLVTGGATRIGRAIATRLHASGRGVIIHYRSSASAASELARALDAETVQGDLCRIEDIDAIAETFANRRLGGIVNNASSFFSTEIGATEASEWDALFGSNARGPYFLTQALVPRIEDGGGIVNVTDIHAVVPLRRYAVYTMAKAALAQMTRAMAKELAPRLRVNAVAPGAITWPVDEPSEAMKANILSHVPLGRLGEPEDIARTVDFLFDSPYITGETIHVDGGRSLG